MHLGGMSTGYGCGTKPELAKSDVDLNGDVSILDLSKVASWFSSSINASTTDPRWEGDIDGDGAISILDMSKAGTYFGRNVAATCPAPTPLAIDGASVTVTIGSAGQNAYYAFNGTAGQYLGLGMTPGGLDGYVRLYDPNGDQVGPTGFMYDVYGSHMDPPALPLTGTYTIKVHAGVTIGSVTLTLSNDIIAPIVMDGASVPVIINRAGKNARYTFNGTAGQYVGIGMTPGGLSGIVRLYDQSGDQVDSGYMYDVYGSDMDPRKLPSTGAYTIKVDPGVTIGSVTLTLSNDIIAPIVMDGASVPVIINRAGKNARYTFNGTAGQYVGIGMTPGGLSGIVRLYDQNGEQVDAAYMYSSSGSDMDPPKLPSTGAYTIKVDPGVTTGSVTLTLSNDISIDWGPAGTTISRVGQNARYSFFGPQGQAASVHVTPGGLSGILRLLKPPPNEAASVTSAYIYASASSDLGPVTLQTTGMYTYKIDAGVTLGNVKLANGNIGPPTDWEADGGEYSYDDGCGAGGEIDPITTILLSNEPTHAAAQQQTEDALEDTGLDDGYDAELTTRQDFKDHGACVVGSITQASEDSKLQQIPGLPDIPWWESRWHARCNVLSQPSFGGYWSACTPHWDETDSDCTAGTWQGIEVPGNHYVPDIFNDHVDGQGNWDGSGFDAGRDWLYWELVVEDNHIFVESVDFDNVQPMKQCNDQWTQADGKVNIIQLQ